jgi:hypothetical protein
VLRVRWVWRGSCPAGDDVVPRRAPPGPVVGWQTVEPHLLFVVLLPLVLFGSGREETDLHQAALRCPPRRLLLLLDAHVRGWRGLWCGSRSGRALLMSDGRAGAQWLLHRLSKPLWKIKNKKMRSAPGQSALLLEPVGGG